MGCGSSQDEANVVRRTSSISKGAKITSDLFIKINDGSISEFYDVKQTLGEGAFGCVKLVIHKQTQTKRAMKQMNKSGIIVENQKQLFSELDILKTLDHPNIIKIHELFQDQYHYYLITEFCEGGELFDRLSAERVFTEKNAAEYMKQLLSAVSYCHEKGIVHRDIKLENLLLESKRNDANLKVIDFGTSRKVNSDEKMDMKIGTIYYIAPEVLKQSYDNKCDVWSCGVILYILLCGYPPFNGDDMTIKKKILEGKCEFDDQEWKNISQDAKSLILKMLTPDPKNRITSYQALQDPWIQSKAPNLPINSNILGNLQRFYSTSKIKDAIKLFIITQAMTLKEKEELQKQFRAMDINNDGTLSREELMNLYSKKNDKEKAKQIVDDIFDSVDLDHSGKVEFTEFLMAATQKEKLNSQQKLMSVFKMFDKDGDGKISRLELQTIMSGMKIDDEEWKKILEECDRDKDGEINLNELIVMMQNIK
ncbi:hypothetical protein pb186bvf_016578 [Paramecium bursaria]